ncbi:MAG: tail fiber domain-containing protein [Fluviicola sp.]
MKKRLLSLSACLMFAVGASHAQVNSPTMYKGSSVNPGSSGSYYGSSVSALGYHSFAGGRNATASGSYSMANGLYSEASGAYSYSFGVRTYATNSHAMSFGIDVRATGNRSITIGSGAGNGVSNALVNNIDRSLMVGFNSTVPTLFVGSSSGGTTTGNVGIGNSAPGAKLDVTGDARVTERMGIGAAPLSGTVLNLFSNTDRTIYALSGNWNSGVGAEIRGGSRGVFGVAGATFTSGTQPTETYGLWGIGVLGSNLSCGVHGDGTGEPAGYAYGVWGTALAGGIASYGVYGNGSGGFGPFYAGYFDGDVYTTGLYLSSDERLKENVDDLRVADKLMMLQPKAYTYKTSKFERMNLPEGTQMGFIAQELEEVFPELVKETVQPPKVDEDGKIIEEGITFKTVNYVGLIPALTATIQEQQKTIEELKARLDMLEEGENPASNLDIEKAELFQNTPNPFNTRTTIRYSVPESIQTASILIFDMNGGLKETLRAEVAENGSVELSANQLQPGMYIYTLVADGKEVASKRMIISSN